MAKLIAQDLQPMLEAPGEVWASCGRGEFPGEMERLMGWSWGHGDLEGGKKKKKQEGGRCLRGGTKDVRQGNGRFEVWR